jgi:hypothetical protein
LKAVPLFFYIFKILVNNLDYLSLVPIIHVVAEGLNNIGVRRIQPKFAFHIVFTAMDMYRLSAFVAIKNKRQPRM